MSASISSHSTLFANPMVAYARTGATIVGWQIRLHSRDLPSPINGCFSSTPRFSPCTGYPSRPAPTSLSSLGSKGTDSGCPAESLFHPEPVLLLPYVRMGLSTLHPDGLFLSFSFSSCPRSPPVRTRGRPAPTPGSDGIGSKPGHDPGRCVFAPIAWMGRPGAWSKPTGVEARVAPGTCGIQTTSSTRDLP